MEPNPTSETLLQHGRFIRELAHALLRDAHAADDVAQETALQWLRHGARSIANPRAWLRSAVRHLASNQKRAAARRGAHEERAAPPEPPRSPAEESERAELIHRLVDAVFALDEPYRETILARYFRGLPAREVAAHRGEPLATVRSRERRALELLRARLDRGRERGAWAVLLTEMLPKRASLLVPAAGLAAVFASIAAVTVAASLWRASPVRERREDARSLASTAEPLLVTSAPAVASPDVQREESALEPAPIVADAEDDGALRGIATNEEGRPLEGVRVRFSRAGEELAPEGTSERDGRFTVNGLSHFTGVGAELQGYRLLHYNDAENDVGPWGELRIVLVRTGRLTLTARDARGRPMEDVEIDVRLVPEDDCETDGTRKSWKHTWQALNGRTDESGSTEIPDVWTGVKLSCSLELDSDSAYAPARYETKLQNAGRLVLEPGLPGVPLLVPRDEDLDLSVVWEREIHLRGSVVWPDGSLSGEIGIDVDDRGRSGKATEQTVASLRSSDGRFDFVLREPYLVGPLLVHTWKRRTSESVSVLGDDGQPAFTIGVSHNSFAGCEVSPDSDDEELRLELHEVGSTWGGLRVVNYDGTPLSEAVDFLVLKRDVSEDPELRFDQVKSGSSLVFLGRLPSPMDIAVSFAPSITGCSTSLHVYPNVLTEGLTELRRPRESDVRVHVRLPSRATRAMALTQASFPCPGRASLGRATPTTLASPWPSGLPSTATSSVSARNLDGVTSTYVEHACFRDGEIVLEPGDAGWYRFGLQVWDAHGRAFAPRTSALAWYDAGEHVLECELVPTATLTGRLVADGTREFLGLALVDEHGAPIPLAPSEDANLTTVVPVATHGRFHLEGVPFGRCRLRAGAVDELAAGRFRREVELDVGPELRLPIEFVL